MIRLVGRRLAYILFAASLFCAAPCSAHGFSGAGWVHPLTGPDHVLAMIAVGAWSAQLGGHAIVSVPLAFVGCMLLGGIAGFEAFPLPGTELGIALSVLLLGLAIATRLQTVLLLAAASVGVFGVCHGYAHGHEAPHSSGQAVYAVGFLATTAGLHVVGLVGGLLVLDEPRAAWTLRIAGIAIATAGLYLVGRLLPPLAAI
jgi:urease accessory protein